MVPTACQRRDLRDVSMFPFLVLIVVKHRPDWQQLGPKRSNRDRVTNDLHGLSYATGDSGFIAVYVPSDLFRGGRVGIL
jgi:hypothetical protein